MTERKSILARWLLATSGIVAACSDSSSNDAPPADSAIADGDAGEALPPEICRTPSAPAGTWFTEVTSEVGLSPTSARPPVGTGVIAGDLDGDGYDDLLTSFFPPGREPEDGAAHTRFVLMNRPDPADSTGKKRVFVDVTYSSGLMATRDGVGGRGWSAVAFGDLDGDRDNDVVLCPGWTQDAKILDGCSAFANDGKGQFTLFDPSELDADVYSVSGPVLVDFDRDGLLDLFPGTIGNWNGVAGSRPRLFKGAGDGSFANVAKDWGLPTSVTDSKTKNLRRNFGITACDLDSDGDMDLLTANYGRDLNYVFRNDGTTFVEVGDTLGIGSDDKIDYSDDWSYQCWCKSNPGSCPAGTPTPPASYCTGFGGTDGRGWVPGYTDDRQHLGGNTFGITCGDIDDDGDIDVMTAETMHSDVGSSSDRSELVLNPTPAGSPLVKFVRPGADAMGLVRTHKAGNWDEGDNAAVFVDLDLDGRKDIFLAESNYPGTHAWVWRQKADGTFEDVTTISGIGQVSAEGPMFLDYDRDGDLDLALGTGTFNGAAKTNAVHFYRNDVGQGSNWTRIALVGKGAGASNTAGVGARIEVTAGGRAQWLDVLPTGGHTGGGQTAMVTFGLGAACTIDAIEVRWPDQAGTVSKYSGVRANYPLVLTEGDPKVKYVQ
jgi:hypothetical protein